MSIIDEHLGKIIKVELKNNRLWCSEHNGKSCMHVFYVMAHEKIGSLIDSESWKK